MGTGRSESIVVLLSPLPRFRPLDTCSEAELPSPTSTVMAALKSEPDILSTLFFSYLFCPSYLRSSVPSSNIWRFLSPFIEVRFQKNVFFSGGTVH